MVTKKQKINFEELLSKKEIKILKKLNTPKKIQDYLETLPFNFEEGGETYMSASRTLIAGTAHCFEGALLAALALWYHGEKPLLLDLKTISPDVDHVVTLFNKDGNWGAISKTNHGVLRYREPVYKSVRELAMSFFHEYFLHNGKKTLRSFSKPFDLSKLGTEWITSRDEMHDLVEQLDRSPHTQILTPLMEKDLRKADPVEIATGKIVVWQKKK